jgi:hypothetical protein
MQPTALPAADRLPPRKRALLFGDDIFISYSRADATVYAEALASRLMDKGFACYLDQYAVPAGRKLPAHVVKAARGSAILVLIATAHALRSDYVEQEIDLFTSTGRPIVIIDPGGRFEELLPNEPTWQRLLGMARTPESMAAIAEGEPSEAVVRRIANAFQFLRKDQRLRRATRWVAAALVGMLVLFLATTGTLGYQTRHAVAERQEAERDSAQALRDTQRARSDARKATAEVATAQQQARVARDATAAAQDKAKRAVSDAQQKIAAARSEAASAEATARQVRVQTQSARSEMLRAKQSLQDEEQRLSSTNTSLKEANRHLDDVNKQLDAANKSLASTQELARTRMLAGIDALAHGSELSLMQRAILLMMQSAETFGGTGGEATPSRYGAAAAIPAISFDLAADGSMIATVDPGTRSVRRFMAASGEELAQLETRADPPKFVYFSPGGRYLAAAGSTHLYVWDARNGIAHEPLVPPILSRDKRTSVVRGVFTPNDKYLVYATGDRHLWLRDTDNVQVALPSPPLDSDATQLAMSPDGKYVAVADVRKLVHVHTVPGLKEVARMSSPLDAPVKAIRFDRAGKLIGVAFGNQNVAFWRWQEATVSIHAASRGR